MVGSNDGLVVEGLPMNWVLSMPCATTYGVPGSIQQNCHFCHVPCWISPETVKIAGPKWVVACLDCAEKHIDIKKKKIHPISDGQITEILAKDESGHGPS